MQPTPAELARTLACGRLLGAAHVRGYRGQLRVCHATGADGCPLLLTRATGDLATALCPAPGADGSSMVLSVDDVPPSLEAPGHGRLWLSGRASRLHGAAARAAAIAYAEVNPTGDLLDVGRGHALYRMDVADVRLARGDTLLEVDLEEFRAAEPDPLHADEHRLLADLNDHHRRQLATWMEAVTDGPAVADCRAVRLDRYGLAVTVEYADGHEARRRLAFARPAAGVKDLARILGKWLCAGCAANARGPR